MPIPTTPLETSPVPPSLSSSEERPTITRISPRRRSRLVIRKVHPTRGRPPHLPTGRERTQGPGRGRGCSIGSRGIRSHRTRRRPRIDHRGRPRALMYKIRSSLGRPSFFPSIRQQVVGVREGNWADPRGRAGAVVDKIGSAFGVEAAFPAIGEGVGFMPMDRAESAVGGRGWFGSAASAFPWWDRQGSR